MFFHTKRGMENLAISIVIYHRPIHSVDELKRRLIDVRSGLKQSIFDEAIDQWRGRHLACVHAKGGHAARGLARYMLRGTYCEGFGKH